MIKKFKKKIVATMLLLLTLLSNILPIFPMAKSLAVNNNNIGTTLDLVNLGEVPYHLKNHGVESGGYVKTYTVGYYDNGNFYPAFCMNSDRVGVDDEREYGVTITEILSDRDTYNKVWRVVTNGYPYKSTEELGMRDWRYAYQATKMAVYCVIGESDINEFYATDEIGQEIIDLINKLVDIGNNGTATYRTPVANADKSENLFVAGDYYVQNYTVNANIEISSYDVAITGFPEGTIVTDTNGNERNTFNTGETFQVRLPKNCVETGDINGKIRASVTSKSYALFYATSYNPTLQDYTITGDPLALTSSVADLILKGNNAKIKIKKVDADTNEPISDTTFKISKEDGTEIGTATTGEDGVVTFNDLYQANYVVEEVKNNEDYVLEQGKINIPAFYNQITDKTITNKHKEGDLTIYKVDKDNHKIALGNVEFDLFSEEFNKVIGTYTTDVNGEIHIKNLRTGNYKVIEKNTGKWYNLADDTNIRIEWNNETKTTIENELKKGQVRVIKVDSDNKEVKLKDVEFQVLDQDGNILETLKTDKNGEALTKEYVIRDYEKLTIKETKTQTGYALSEDTKTITLSESQITNVVFENEKIKGRIEITKVSADNNKLTKEVKGTPLENAVFEIYTEDNKLVDTVTTAKDGKATSKLLEYGNYYVKEKYTGSDYYLLNTEKYEIRIREHNKTIPVTIENKSVEVGLDIEKNGIAQAQPNDEIKYSFNSLRNISNVAVNNFTWIDNLPYEYVRITKLFTGTYNEDLEYSVKYKTNKSEDYIEYGKYNTLKNNYIDFTKIELDEDEFITDYKTEFGTVMPGFEAIEKPFIFTKVLPTVKAEDKWVNHTSLTGNYKEHKLEDKAEWPTISYSKKLEIKKLPRTGF